VRHALERFRTPAPPVSDVADEVGLSARRFIELFKDEVGLAPKLFCRVRRFQRAVRLVHGRTDVDWADVALDCGYFDQAHLIHEFREFSGLSPTAYLRVRSSHLNHVPLPA
jgi:AraC-like DNA-binding protein